MTVHIGETIKKLRREKQITQETLANFLGVSFQCISKWERGENCPDISMLPSIASFFGVSTDYLLGISEIETEKRINFYKSEYSRLWSEHKIADVKTLMKEAVIEFPGNYDLLVRYFNALISQSSDGDHLNRIRDEVCGIYERIQEHCTADSIRIWAKKLMCRYFRNLSIAKADSSVYPQAEKVLSEMPLMQNARDYVAVTMYPADRDKTAAAAAECISELLRLLGDVIYCKYDMPFECDEDIIKGYIDFLRAVMPDGDYGKSFQSVIHAYGYLGVKKHQREDHSGAMECFEKCVQLAKEYDEMPEVTIHTSNLLRGLEFDKTKTVMGVHRMRECVKHLLANIYPLTDEFRNIEGFRQLIESL